MVGKGVGGSLHPYEMNSQGTLGLIRRQARLASAAALLAVLFVVNPCFAGLSASVNYYCQNNGQGRDCTLPFNGIHATTADNTPLTIGDAFGGASAQAGYNGLSCRGTGAWLPEQAPTPSYAGSGDSSARAEDTITLSGGTGTSVQVGAMLDLTGTFADSYPPARFQVISASVDVGGYSTSVFLAKTSYAEIDVGGNYGGRWTSADGTFETGNHVGVPQVTPAGQLVLPQVTLPLNTPIAISTNLSVQGSNSATSTANARLTLVLPQGVTLISQSAEKYGTAEVPVVSVPLPWWAMLALALLLLLEIARRSADKPA